MTEVLAIARAVHVAAIVHWIGGLFFVTFVLLPSLMEIEPSQRLAAFDRLERRFGAQARVSTALAGITGFYLLYGFSHWGHVATLQFWWLDAMIALWAIFTVMLFVAEPLFLHKWFDARAKKDADGAFLFALRAHRVLSALSLITVLGGAAGAHGLF